MTLPPAHESFTDRSGAATGVGAFAAGCGAGVDVGRGGELAGREGAGGAARAADALAEEGGAADPAGEPGVAGVGAARLADAAGTTAGRAALRSGGLARMAARGASEAAADAAFAASVGGSAMAAASASLAATLNPCDAATSAALTGCETLGELAVASGVGRCSAGWVRAYQPTAAALAASISPIAPASGNPAAALRLGDGLRSAGRPVAATTAAASPRPMRAPQRRQIRAVPGLAWPHAPHTIGGRGAGDTPASVPAAGWAAPHT
ncbi:MAG: hypothetical protein ABIO45_14610 [Burkholderiaceae bacterium]